MQHPSALLWSDRAQDKEWLDLLWEVGRSVTIQVRLCPSETDWALARNHASECLKSIKDAALSATFLDFAHLVKLLNIQQVSDGLYAATDVYISDCSFCGWPYVGFSQLAWKIPMVH